MSCFRFYIHVHVHVVVLLQEREAAQRAAELATRALAAEKRLVEAMKDEAAASAELLDAERAAKFAAQVRLAGERGGSRACLGEGGERT